MWPIWRFSPAKRSAALSGHVANAAAAPLGRGGGPNITGQSVENIRIQLEANESMTFILLDDAEFAQVSAYLKWVVGLY